MLANGCTDGTESIVAAYARSRPEVELHAIGLGDKSNAWNFYVHGAAPAAAVHCFVDGDVRVAPGAIAALAAAFGDAPPANAAAALPAGGRNVATFEREVRESHALAGNLYALSADFVARVRAARVRLPVGLIGRTTAGSARSRSWTSIRTRAGARSACACAATRASRSIRCAGIGRPTHGCTGGAASATALRRWQTVAMLRAHIADHGIARLPSDVRELYRDYAHLCRLRWSGLDTLFLWLARERIHGAMRGA